MIRECIYRRAIRFINTAHFRGDPYCEQHHGKIRDRNRGLECKRCLADRRLATLRGVTRWP